MPASFTSLCQPAFAALLLAVTPAFASQQAAEGTDARSAPIEWSSFLSDAIANESASDSTVAAELIASYPLVPREQRTLVLRALVYAPPSLGHEVDALLLQALAEAPVVDATPEDTRALRALHAAAAQLAGTRGPLASDEVGEATWRLFESTLPAPGAFEGDGLLSMEAASSTWLILGSQELEARAIELLEGLEPDQALGARLSLVAAGTSLVTGSMPWTAQWRDVRVAENSALPPREWRFFQEQATLLFEQRQRVAAEVAASFFLSFVHSPEASQADKQALLREGLAALAASPIAVPDAEGLRPEHDAAEFQILSGFTLMAMAEGTVPIQ